MLILNTFTITIIYEAEYIVMLVRWPFRNFYGYAVLQSGHHTEIPLSCLGVYNVFLCVLLAVALENVDVWVMSGDLAMGLSCLCVHCWGCGMNFCFVLINPTWSW